MKKKIVIDVTNDFPVYVSLNRKNPWNSDTIKVNNIVIGQIKTIINTKQELEKLRPIEDYLIVEVIPKENKIKESKISVEEESKVEKKTRKRKTTKEE